MAGLRMMDPCMVGEQGGSGKAGAGGIHEIFAEPGRDERYAGVETARKPGVAHSPEDMMVRMTEFMDGKNDTTLSKVFGWIAAILGFGFMATLLLAVIQVSRYGYFDDLVREHVPCTIGLPCAAMASLILVLILRTVAGNVEVKVLGFEFKGASGPLIMWILCFLSMALAINKTWDLKYEAHPAAEQRQPELR